MATSKWAEVIASASAWLAEQNGKATDPARHVARLIDALNQSESMRREAEEDADKFARQLARLRGAAGIDERSSVALAAVWAVLNESGADDGG